MCRLGTVCMYRQTSFFSTRETLKGGDNRARARGTWVAKTKVGRRPCVESVWSPNVKFDAVASKWRPNHAPLSLLFLASMLVSD